MQPFTVTSDFTKEALTLNPSAGQGYNAVIQQTATREKVNDSLNSANAALQSLSFGGSL